MTGPRVSRSAGAVLTLAVAATAAVTAGMAAGAPAVDVAWAPTWNLRLAMELDGLAALYALLAAGIGVLVFTFATAYVPRHLAHQERPRGEELRLHASMGLFLVAMLGLATAQDLFLLFVFWDLTAVASYLLIGFDRASRHARLSALMALLVTGGSAVLMLIGILILRVEYGTTQIPELFELAEASTAVTAAMVLIGLAALAKSAQVPFHFWLPRAMAAPTPVSAYLHSAAMVAAGVFLLSRLHPLLALEPALLDGLIVFGLASMAVGGVLALAADGLKRLLAYSTIAQYGYVTAMLGVGGETGVAAACFYVVAHAVAKSALFMTAGAVTEATGEKALSEVGGLARPMPLLAAGSAVAAASIAALPLTMGFFKDELFFKAASERGTWLAVLAVAGAALTFAYMVRFWTSTFLGRRICPVQDVPRRLVWPVAVLGAASLAGGVVVAPVLGLVEEAAGATLLAPVSVKAAYHLDLRTENVMALATWAAGLALLGLHGRIAGVLSLVERTGNHFGPERAYAVTLRGLNRLSDRLHDIEVRDLRARLAAVVVPGSALVALGVVATPTTGTYKAGGVPSADVPLVVALAAVALAAMAATLPRRHLAMAVTLSGVGFALATAFSIMGAPDVALVAVVVETIFALLFVAVFSLVDPDILRREAQLREARAVRIRDVAIAVVSGAVTTLVVWSALSRPLTPGMTADRQIALADEAHGKDVVTVILADFRGLDTLVEITVVLVAVIAVTGLLRGRLRG